MISFSLSCNWWPSGASKFCVTNFFVNDFWSLLTRKRISSPYCRNFKYKKLCEVNVIKCHFLRQDTQVEMPDGKCYVQAVADGSSLFPDFCAFIRFFLRYVSRLENSRHQIFLSLSSVWTYLTPSETSTSG